MTDPTAQFANETYYEGLRNGDPGTIEALYTEFRKSITRAVEAAGGSSADGATFFRVAVIQASSLACDLQLDETIPVFYYLKNLAIAHFSDWAKEKGLEQPELPPVSEEEAAHSITLPDADARLEFRQCIRARRQFSRLDGDCQKRIRELAKDASLGLTDPRLEGGASKTCLEKYRKNLGENAETWGGQLPVWAVTALTDEQFQKTWSLAESLESRLSMGQSATPEPPSKVTRNVLIVLGLLVLGYGFWLYFNPSKSAKTIYNENFNPPASIMADRAARMARDTVPQERNELCEQLFEEADAAYKRKAYAEAADVLYNMLGEETEPCHSDVLYYLAIIGLQLNEPEITVDCLAKIPDLDRFGEDLYWYQALAFVKIAAQNPLRRDIARRAVERARSNTEIPERRAQAEKMLEELAK